MSENIIIKQEYFTNIQTAINSLNDFFTSGFKNKNFPVLDGDYQLEPTIERIVSRLNGVDPTWMEDSNKVHDIVETISDNLKNIDPVDGVYATIVNSNNKTLLDAIDAYVGFKILQYIADHFPEFGKFVNGIYTFEVFTKPSQYTDVLDLFGKFIPLDEIPELDLEEKIFDEGFFVEGLMKSSQIEFPESMTTETETERIINRQDLTDVEVFVDDSVQEAAEVNYFENVKPAHLKYNENTDKFQISKQFEAKVDKFISSLRGCDTTDDLIKLFSDLGSVPEADDFTSVVIPYILAKVYSNPRKYYNENYDKEKMDNYTKSYDSILDQNNGAKRFKNYDLFSTFKTDKDGTIQFIEDFLKLKLINDENASISNNTLLTLFNIFDSRIYLDIAYNMLPDTKKKEKFENQFVTEIRSRINKNSKSKNAYDGKDESEDESDKNTSDAVTEYVSNTLSKLGEMSISDMTYCEQFYASVMAEIDTLDDRVYNEGISPFLLDEYIGESYYEINNHLDDVFIEANIHKRREALQSAVSCLIEEMENIVKLNKKNQWNNNKFVHSYKTTASSIFPTPIIPWVNPTGSTENHTDIKQVHKWTGKAAKGKCGNFTSQQLTTLNRLHGYVDELWANVKLFWINPRNWTKRINIFNNTKIQSRVKNVARIAAKIVEMKDSLNFLQDEDFVNEAWYDGTQEFIYQEATTETNHARLKTSIDLLMRDMGKIAELSNKKQWTNNACISTFKGEVRGNVKQALKYANRGIGGSCGKLNDADKNTLNNLIEKLEELMRSIKLIDMNPLIGKSIKESSGVRKIASLAGEIVGMKSNFEFLNSPSNKNKSNDGETVQESATVMGFDEFMMIMEQEDGSIPEYMKTRLKLSDDLSTTVTPTKLPDGVPHNDLGDLTDSINAKLDAGGGLEDMLGSGFENNPNKDKHEGKVVINITNNYTNSFNKDSGNTTTTTTDDHSTGKSTNTSNSNNNTNSHNDSSHDNRNDNSSRKNTSSNKSTGANNNNNSNDSVDPKDSPTIADGKQKLSSGKTIQEMFMFLESKEPQSSGNNAGKPPKEDTLTKAMDADRKTLATHQKNKKGLQKIANTGKAVFKPITRTKQWLTKVVDSLIKRDEDKVKAELIENKSYRSTLYKATRLALKLGLIGVAFTIQPYLGIAAVGVEGLKMADKHRLKKEIQDEMEAEIEIIDDKISKLDTDNPEDLKKKYELMRLKKKAEKFLIDAPKSTIKHPRSVW